MSEKICTMNFPESVKWKETQFLKLEFGKYIQKHVLYKEITEIKPKPSVLKIKEKPSGQL